MPPAATVNPSPNDRVEPVGGEHAERSRSRRISSSDGTKPTRRSIAGQEDRDREPAGEEVADVVVDERRREVTPPLVADRPDDRAEVDRR